MLLHPHLLNQAKNAISTGLFFAIAQTKFKQVLIFLSLSSLYGVQPNLLELGFQGYSFTSLALETLYLASGEL
jgi:hypothetical protein